jgi:hypothetical protein
MVSFKRIKPRSGDGQRRAPPVAVLRQRDFRLLWGGQFVSVLGTQMHAVALSWQVYQLTGSVVQLGLLGLVRAVSLMGASLIGGPVADRSDRRALMLRTQIILLLLSAGLALVTALDAVNIAVLYGVAMAASVASAFDGPARQALIPQLVPREQLGAATSLNMLAMSTARMVGPAVGGLAVAWIDVAGAYALDALSFLAVIWALVVMETPLSRPEVRASGLAAVAEGLQFIWRTPVIFGVMLVDFLATLLGSTVGLAPVFAEDVLGVGPQGLGLLLSAPAAGAVLGGFGLSLLPMPARPGRALIGAVVAYGACLVLFGLSASFVLALLCLAGAGAADAVSVAMRHAVRLLATPDELRGRVAASHSALAMGGPRLGEFQSGMSAALIGPRAAMVVGGLACGLVAVGVARLIPAMMRYRFDDAPEHAPRSAPAAGAARKATGD